ncbi:aldehyde dehydrogenase [Facklamia sp. P12955]|uniref:aldehyde dehydrogenase n=1 Tax=Facklamia sp. P12955 TaxID=3421946 RepID=UPI003D180B69
MEETSGVLEKQKEYFASGETKAIDFRIAKLKKLYQAIEDYELEILEALRSDLNKAGFEGYVSEIGLVLEEITYMLKNMKRLLKPKRVRTPISQFPSVSRVYKEPYGQVLIIAPWNYPFLLTLSPLVGALAAGNTAVIKPSEFAPATSAIIKKMIADTFDPAYVTVVEGAVEVNQSLLSKDFDLIFFTGSKQVGKIVMEKAAQHLTPVVLELGGKSPAIVDKSADIKIAAKRIAWGKALNAGQTCVAPDYLLVQEDVKEKLTEELMKTLEGFFGKHAETNPEYPKIISDRHYQRLLHLLETGKVIYGGQKNDETHQINITLMEDVSWKDPIMQEEIFGPILPIITYKTIDEAMDHIKARPKPLALYLFTKEKDIERKVLTEVSFGGGAINETVTHLATPYMGFGGVGESGMGSYNGKNSIDTFSHSKSILKKSNWLDLPFRYPPYKTSIKWIKKIMK